MRNPPVLFQTPDRSLFVAPAWAPATEQTMSTAANTNSKITKRLRILNLRLELIDGRGSCAPFYDFLAADQNRL